MKRAIEAAAIAIHATREEAAALELAAIRAERASSPLWFALPPSPAPRATAPLDELLAWCATAVAPRRDPTGLGALIGLVHEIYSEHGWAVAAAQVALGSRALPEVGVVGRARERFVAATADVVADAEPDVTALEASGVEPPGGDFVRGALASTIEALATSDLEASHPEATLDQVAALLAVELQVGTDRAQATALDDVLVALHDLGRHEATWESILAWRDGDPLILAKAMARGLGQTSACALLVEVQVALAARIADLVEAAWRGEVDRTRTTSSAPLADAILDLADDAAAIAARRIATAALARWEGGRGEDLASVCTELLGDPRDVSSLWEAHASRIREVVA